MHIHKKVALIVFNDFTKDNRVLKEAQSLESNGFSVHVVALHENSLPEREIVDRISIHRIRLKTRKWPKIKFVQFFKYIEFISIFVKNYRKFDIIHCNDLITLPFGLVVKIFFNRKVKIIYDAHEYAINDTPNESSKKIKLKYYIEKFLIKYADKVITVSDSIANEYKNLYGIPKPTLVLNCPTYRNIQKQNLFRKELGIREDQTIFLYQGGLSQGRGIEIILDSFSSLKDDNNVVVFMGYGPLETNVKRKISEHNNIFFKNAVSPEILLDYTASADYGILFYEPVCLNHTYCLPNKLFEYLMAEIPVLTSNLFEIKNFIHQYNIGIVTETNDMLGFLNSIKRIKMTDKKLLLDNINKTKHLFTWKEQEEKLLRIYDEL